ncbi:MAG: short-chain dehydrogenase/reductase [Dehalococcoidia bacterium]|mgnify:CR=1 FL=1|nr:short-chain dehydrogenase/reductase [Dehalococcoidia bacterium]HCV00405.1 short-chain dehydrogenase/reductase [Dehalococcoidia bacterium]|tara:strand:- start:1737 stop:2597 length:861 start_codon:yes stop_codon:yes gene_type:complete
MVMEDQVVFVTGASQGAGAAITAELVERGHRVVASMRSPKRDGGQLEEAHGDRVFVTQCDVTDRASVWAAVTAGMEHFGRIDALVNNVGILLMGAIEELTDEEITLGMETNFGGQIRAAQAVLPHMRAQGAGKIINVGSSSGRFSGALGGLYSATKHALEGMTEALRFEVARWGVQVILVQPGEFKTRIHNKNRVLAKALQDGTSLYQEAALDGKHKNIERAGSRPGPRTLASTIADIVELEQPLPIRWPVGYDTLQSFALRDQLTDAQWEEQRLQELHPFFRDKP